MNEDNELYEIDRDTASRYVFTVTPEHGNSVTCLAHDLSQHMPARDLWGTLLRIEHHEREHHGKTDAPVPYVPASPEEAAARLTKLLGAQYGYTAPDTTTVLPVVASAGNRPASPFRAKHVTAGSVPPGRDWTALAAVGLDVRHQSAQDVTIHRWNYPDGTHVFVLPADGFPGAKWEIRAEQAAPPAAYVLQGPVPATGPARVCTRCGGPLDPHAVELPVGIGSRSATHPATLCRSCYDGFADMTVEWVLGTDVVMCAAGAPHLPGRCPEKLPDSLHGPDAPTADMVSRAQRCPNCLASIQRCNAGGCGGRQAPGWRVAQQRSNGMEVRG